MDTEIAIINNVVTMKNTSIPEKITGIGERLKLAREAMHLSQKEAAARLYLNIKMINIMENETFAEGPPATFMRGYLHSYARLLNLPEDEVNNALKELEVNLPPNRDVTNRALHTVPQTHDRYVRWITLFVIFTLILLVCIWWSSHSKYAIADVPTKTETHPPSAPTTVTSQPANHVNKTLPMLPTTVASSPASITSAPPLSSPNKVPAPILAPPPTLAKPIVSNNPPAMNVETQKNKPNKKAAKKSTLNKTKNIVLSLPEPGSQ